MIEIKDAIVGYDIPLFKIQKLHLESGKVYALIGKNGMGKSTFLNTLVGQIPLMTGTLKINGSNIKDWKARQFTEAVAYVSSRFEVVDYLSVKEYISFGKFPKSNWLGNISTTDAEEVMGIIDEIGLNALTGKNTSEISDGERQLCSLAKALAQNTRTLILDEPSAFLDYSNRKKMIQVLTNLASNKNKCILLSTHDLDMAFDEKLHFIALVDNNLQEVQLNDKKEFMNYFS